MSIPTEPAASEQEALRVLTRVLPENYLNEVKILVFQQAWIGKGYAEIAAEFGYDPDYVRKMGALLWQTLSEVLGRAVTKRNFRSLLQRYVDSSSINPLQEVPGGPVPLNSPFYVARPAIEASAFAELAKPGSLLRLKAPQKMGKSTLMLRLMHQALSLNYQTLYLDLQLADQVVLADPDRFLRWFCANASRRLGLPAKLDEYWDQDTGSKTSCLVYLQDYLLRQVETPLVIFFNEVNRIFDYPVLAQEFLPLVRSIYEASRYTPVLQKLRLVLAYSTEIYVPLKLNQSPFNVGLSIEIPEFTLAEIEMLAAQYGFNWANLTDADAVGSPQVVALQDLVGGHPYLVQSALYHLANRVQSNPPISETAALTALLENASTLSGIYSDHLQRLLSVLYAHPDLATALEQVVSTSTGIKLPPLQTHKLQSLGLITLQGDRAVVSCNLYQRYFSNHMLSKIPIDLTAS